MKSLIMKGPILLFLVSNCLSKSKYYLVETADKVKLPTETENDDVNVNHQQRRHNKGMNACSSLSIKYLLYKQQTYIN